jgi:hypothetical protein
MRPLAFHLLWGLPLSAVAAGLLVALWPAGEPSPTVPTVVARTSAPAPEASGIKPAPATVVMATPALAPDPLQGLSPQERQALAAALSGHPSRDAEMRRVAGFLRLQRQVEAWRAARARPGDAAVRQELAARIEAALPSALADRSVSAGEALQLQARLITDREPDPARADAELAAWRTRHVPPAEAPDRAFLARQQQLVAAHSRRPDTLEPALEALRRQHFARPD